MTEPANHLAGFLYFFQRKGTEMSEDTATTPKRRPGRPRKPDATSLIAALQEQVLALQEALAVRAETKQLASLAAVPSPSEELKPGTYVEIGRDSSGAPILGKVAWTRDWIERTYEPVTFIPARTMTVAPHGISYRLEQGEPNTVPSIVRAIYEDCMRSERAMALSTRPLSAAEVSDIDARASEAPGTKQWSRLYRSGYGLAVTADDATSDN
jgi:hypothetical protein